MARSVPADLEDALAASPAARERFWAMPSEQKDSWVAYVERSRFPGARRRRVTETVRRRGGGHAVATTVERNGAAPAPAPMPRNDWAIWLVALALVAILAGVVLWLTVFRDDGSKPSAVVVAAQTTVPKVTGIRHQAAEFQLKEAKLTWKLTRKTAAKPKGIVLAQQPKDGKTVQPGTQVVLVVSNGPPGVAMPDVVGLAAADAIKALGARKLDPTLQQKASTEAPGTVLAQQPKAGSRAKPGTTVVLQVAKGAASIAVPDVTGATEAQAGATLRAAGLASHVVQVPSTKPAGTVVAQSPPAGQKLARGGSVRLNVSKGGTTTATTGATTTQQTTTTPTAAPTAYTGMRLGAAVQKLAQGRQQAIVQYVASSRPAGVVVSSATAGSRVRLQVSAGVQPKPATDVPDVIGEDATTAEQDLQAAGFTVIQIAWPVSDSSQDGMVTYETPAGAAQIPTGSAVVIYVGSATGG
jgi:beta-lactam-binding protein with PASTA domain